MFSGMARRARRRPVTALGFSARRRRVRHETDPLEPGLLRRPHHLRDHLVACRALGAQMDFRLIGLRGFARCHELRAHLLQRNDGAVPVQLADGVD